LGEQPAALEQHPLRQPSPDSVLDHPAKAIEI
jgi:hypothetical protein